MAFPACDLLACVDALAGCGHVGGGLDALRIQRRGTWFGVPPLGLTDQASQQAVEPVEPLPHCAHRHSQIVSEGLYQFAPRRLPRRVPSRQDDAFHDADAP